MKNLQVTLSQKALSAANQNNMKILFNFIIILLFRSGHNFTHAMAA